MDEQLIADLEYVATYAIAVAADLKNGKKPKMAFVNGMAELADKVQRSLDPNYEEWCNALAETRR